MPCLQSAQPVKPAVAAPCIDIGSRNAETAYPRQPELVHESVGEEIVPSYAAAGASALSILTDEKFFGGSLKDIRTARPLVEIPILRKDFMPSANSSRETNASE